MNNLTKLISTQMHDLLLANVNSQPLAYRWSEEALEILKIHIPEEDEFETLNGILISLLDRIPNDDEKFEISQWDRGTGRFICSWRRPRWKSVFDRR